MLRKKIMFPFTTLAGPMLPTVLADADTPMPTLEALTALAAARRVRTALGQEVRFVLQEPQPKRRRRRKNGLIKPNPPPYHYEERIYQTGEVPTRAANWHDVFNAFVWCRFPLSKAALNERQCRAFEFATPRDIARGQIRTREQDRLTMFDEGGAIVVHRPESSPLIIVFGHAVLEGAFTGPRSLDYVVMTLQVTLATRLTDASLDRQLDSVDALIAALVRSGVFTLDADIEDANYRGSALLELLALGSDQQQ